MAVLHAEISLANARVAKAESDKDRYYADLIAAEARADRMKSASTQAMRSQSVAPEKEESKPPIKEEVKAEDSEAKIPTLASLETNGQTFVNGHSSPIDAEDEQTWKSLYEACDRRNQELTEELMALKSRCSGLTSEVSGPHPI